MNHRTPILFALIELLSIFAVTQSFYSQRMGTMAPHPRVAACMSAPRGDAPVGGNAQSRALFKLTEAFGSIIGDRKLPSLSVTKRGSRAKAVNIKTIGNQIKKEYDAIFWATGNMDMSLWADNCTFADPFSSFGGENSAIRFKKNADNLSRLVDGPVCRVTSYEVTENQVIVGWTFSSRLKLPWKPVLAAAGTTYHTIDERSGLIVEYKETWKSKPWDVIKRLFVPGS